MKAARILTAFAVSLIVASQAGVAADKAKKIDTRDRGVKVNVVDHESIPHIFRSDSLIGMTVRNKDGKDLGSVNDLVIDFENRHVRYAALSFGGFLGFGNKLFAVPLSAMELKFDSSDDKSYLVFDVDEETLKNSPGFDQNDWPDVADKRWSHEIDKFYGVEFDDTRVGVEVERKSGDRDRTAKTEAHHVLRASQLDGMTVQNAAKKDLGSVSDLVIDADTGMLTHLVVRTGATAGVGGNLVIVPAKPFTMRDKIEANERILMLPVSLEAMKEAPHVGDHWPNFHEDNWAKRFDDYFAKKIDGEA